MDNKTATAFFIHLARCLMRAGVTKGAILDGYKDASLNIKNVRVSPDKLYQVEEICVGLATTYFELNK